MPHQDYVQWQRNCLQQMMRLLQPDGAISYNATIPQWQVQVKIGFISNRLLKKSPARL